VAGNEDVDGDVSGEEAAWRDLVARFEMPVDTEAEQAPWPARENLTESARDRQRPDQDAEQGFEDPGRRPGPASLPSRPGGGLWPEPGDEPAPAAQQGPDTAPQDATPAEATDPGGIDPGGIDPGGIDPGGIDPGGIDPGGIDPGGIGPGGIGPGGTASSGTASSSTAQGTTGRADQPRIIRRAGPGRPDQVADEDEDDRYRPPPPDPLPPLDPVTKGAWAGVLGGPGYLLVARLADWQIPNWAALAAIIAFVAGFATLVVRMGDRPRDDDDDGAVV
jgi:hypothetical protein